MAACLEAVDSRPQHLSCPRAASGGFFFLAVALNAQFPPGCTLSISFHLRREPGGCTRVGCSPLEHPVTQGSFHHPTLRLPPVSSRSPDSRTIDSEGHFDHVAYSEEVRALQQVRLH